MRFGSPTHSVIYGLVKTAQMAEAADSGRSGERWKTISGATAFSEDTHNPGHYMFTRNYGPTGEMENFYLKLTPEQRDAGNFSRKDVLGHVGSHPMGQDRWEINSLYVDPQHRRKGIANALVDYHVNKVHPNKQMVVLTDPDKEGNVAKNYLTKLYAKHGFSGELREVMPGAMHRPASGDLAKIAAAQPSPQNNTNKKYIVPALGAAGAAALGYGVHRTAPYYKAKADNLGTWVQALDNKSPDLHILNGVRSHVDPDVGPRVASMIVDPLKNGVESRDGSRWRTAIHSRKPSFAIEITNSGHLDAAGRKAPFAAGGSLPTKDLDSWGEALKAKMHEDATVYGRTLDPNEVNSAVDSLVDRHRKNPFRRAAAFAEDATDHLKNNKTKYLIGGALAAGAAFGGKKLYDRYKQRNTQGQ